MSSFRHFVFRESSKRNSYIWYVYRIRCRCTRTPYGVRDSGRKRARVIASGKLSTKIFVFLLRLAHNLLALDFIWLMIAVIPRCYYLGFGWFRAHCEENATSVRVMSCEAHNINKNLASKARLMNTFFVHLECYVFSTLIPALFINARNALLFIEERFIIVVACVCARAMCTVYM